MVHHLILWNFLDGLTAEQKAEYSRKIAQELESLPQKIAGIRQLQVITNPLPSSNADFALISSFDDQAALDAYQVHPEHQRVAAYIRSLVKSRACIDYQE